jgi:hypothetical protein
MDELSYCASFLEGESDVARTECQGGRASVLIAETDLSSVASSLE